MQQHNILTTPIPKVINTPNKISNPTVKMCTSCWDVHLCGERIRHIETLHCFYKKEADRIESVLNSSGVRNGPLEHEIRRFRELCAQEAHELHYLEFVMGCQACMWTYTSLGTAEVARLIENPQIPRH